MAESRSKYFELAVHPMDNLEELKYREEVQPTEKTFRSSQNWIAAMRKEKFRIPELLRRNGVDFHGRILEIGAGSCWFSSLLSKFPEVEEVYALDFSGRILLEIAPAVMDYLGADAAKIVRVRGSFYDLTRLNKKFDLVVCDETLHHAADLGKLLKQIYRVLRDDGLIVSMREPIAPRLPVLNYVSKRMFGHRERKYGVTENTYALDEWDRIFRDSGFDVTYYSLNLAPERRSVVSAIPGPVLKMVYGANLKLLAFVAKKLLVSD